MGDDLARKLQIKGQRLAVLQGPEGFHWDGMTVEAPAAGDAVLLFVSDAAAYHMHKRPAVDAALRDDVAWIAYPKAGQLDTDLNRDILDQLCRKDRIRAVRNIAIDDTWSALRFRPVA